MVDLIFLEYISLVSFLYSLILMFTSFAPLNHMIILFIWTVTISFIYSMVKIKFKDIIILLLLIPLIFYSSKSAIFLLVLTFFYIYAYSKRALGQVNYFEYVYKLKINYFIFIILVSIRLILDDLDGSIGYALPFIMIYFISSILLTRLMRHMDSNLDIKTIRKTNIKYTIFTAIGFIIGLFEELRNGLVNLLNNILTALFYPIYYLTRKFNMEGELPKNIQEISIEETSETIAEMTLEEAGEGTELGQQLQKAFDMFNKIVAIISILALIYILYKLITRTGNNTSVNSDYIEEREFIKGDEKKKKRFNREKLPKESNEQIRYYYRRYLERLKKNKLEIPNSYTSKEVNQIAEGVNQVGLDRIREIYIKVRYGNIDANLDTVNEMRNLFKNL